MSIRQCLQDIITASKPADDILQEISVITAYISFSADVAIQGSQNGTSARASKEIFDQLEPSLIDWVSSIKNVLKGKSPSSRRLEFKFIDHGSCCESSALLRDWPVLRRDSPTPFADLLAEIGNNALEGLFVRSVDFRGPFETLRLSNDPHSQSLRDPSVAVLRGIANVIDFYFLFHLLRSTCQSPKDLSALVQKDETRLQSLVNRLDTEIGRFSLTSAHAKSDHWKTHVLFTIAKKRGIVASSFFVDHIVPLGDFPLGRGGFADVWKGCEANKTTTSGVFALKVLKTFDVTRTHTELLKALCREAALWRMTNCPNVVKFVGVSRVNDERINGKAALASPWMKNGNLLAYAESHAIADRSPLLAQVAKGLIYLHSIEIIHGDLKCANVLVNDDGIAQLADFGLSSIGDGLANHHISTSNSAGNPRWLAPELMFPSLVGGTGKTTRESDVYAFGMTALELFTGKAPFHGLSDPAIPLEVTIRKYRPPHPGPEAKARGFTDSLWALMEQCWHHDPSSRPTTVRADSDVVDFAISSVSELHATCYLPYASRDIALRGSVSDVRPKKEGWFKKVLFLEFDSDMTGRIDQASDIKHHCYAQSNCKCSKYPKRRVSCRVVSSRVNIHREFLANRVWKRMFCHANVAPLIGICEVLSPLKTGLLYNVGDSAEPLLDYLSKTPITNRLYILNDISSALDYLHGQHKPEHGIVHGDLRCECIIVENEMVRLVDYGVPWRIKFDKDSLARKVFEAPELLRPSNNGTPRPTFSSDVYALAMTFYEILTERLPFSNSSLSEPELLDKIAFDNLRPDYPGSIAEERGLTCLLWNLLCRCWSADIEERPAASDISNEIGRLKEINNRCAPLVWSC